MQSNIQWYYVALEMQSSTFAFNMPLCFLDYAVRVWFQLWTGSKCPRTLYSIRRNHSDSAYWFLTSAYFSRVPEWTAVYVLESIKVALNCQDLLRRTNIMSFVMVSTNEEEIKPVCHCWQFIDCSLNVSRILARFCSWNVFFFPSLWKILESELRFDEQNQNGIE